MSHLPKQKLLANLTECGIIAQMRSDALGKITLALVIWWRYRLVLKRSFGWECRLGRKTVQSSVRMRNPRRVLSAKCGNCVSVLVGIETKGN